MKSAGKLLVGKESFRGFLASMFSLGLLWTWYIFAGNVGPRIFGIELVQNGFFQVTSQFSLTVTLFVLSLKRIRITDSSTCPILLGAIGCGSSAALFWLSDFIDEIWGVFLIVSGLLAGFSFALLLCVWIVKNKDSVFELLFIRVVSSSIIMALCYLLISISWLITIICCVIVIPALMAVLLRMSGSSYRDSGRENNSSRNASSGGFFLLISLCLSMFANGLLIIFWIPHDAANWITALIPIGVVILLIIILIQRKISPSLCFAFLAAFICAVIVFILFFPMNAPLTSNLVFAGFWFLLAFSYASAVWFGPKSADESARGACRYLAFIFASCLLSEVVGSFFAIQDLACLVIVAVLLAFSLAFSLAGGNLLSPTNKVENSEMTVSLDMSESCKRIAAEKGLTERESDVFYLLSKGYSVKSISEKLFVSENTVKSHRTRVYRKLGVSSRQELIDLVEGSSAVSQDSLDSSNSSDH